MDRMSIWSILFAGFPEELVIVIATLTAAGYKDTLNFKNKKNILKLLLASFLILVFTVIGRAVLPSVTLNFLLQIAIIYIILFLVFRHKALASALGLMLALVIYIASESIFISAITYIFNTSLEQLYNNDLLRILASIPERIAQILAIVVICKIRNINMKIEKLSFRELIPIVLYFLIILSSMVSIEASIKNLNNDIVTLMKLIINIIIAIAFSSWTIYSIFKLKKRIYLKENMHDVELQHVKQLLEEGRTDYVIELIDLTLKEKGYYSK